MGDQGAITEARGGKDKEWIFFFKPRNCSLFSHQALTTVASTGLSNRPWTICGQEQPSVQPTRIYRHPGNTTRGLLLFCVVCLGLVGRCLLGFGVFVTKSVSVRSQSSKMTIRAQLRLDSDQTLGIPRKPCKVGFCSPEKARTFLFIPLAPQPPEGASSSLFTQTSLQQTGAPHWFPSCSS